MTQGRNTGGYLPTAEQLLLLRACALEPGEALPAWEQWRNHFQPDTADKAALRLFPALYRNLQRAGYSGPEMPLLKEAYQRNWVSNRKLFNLAEESLAHLHRAGIPTLLIKGVALSHTCYPDPYMRCMADADIVVPTDRAEAAIATMQAAGWKLLEPLGYPYPPTAYAQRLKRQYQRTSHAIHLVNDKGNDIEDLHWHIIQECCGPQDDVVFWQRAVPLCIGSQQTLTLCPADQLLHTCLHGYMWNACHSMRWVLDAHRILAAAGDAIDWDAMIVCAAERQLTLRLTEALTFLRTSWGAPIPDFVLERLRTVAISSFERSEHELLIQEHIRNSSRLFLWPLKWAWYRQRRRYPERPLAMRVLTFPAMLSNELYLSSLWQLPAALIRLAWVKVYHRYRLPG